MIQGLKTAALREGVGIIVKNAQKGPINERIRAYCILMGSDRYRIMRRCKHTIEALQTAVWDGKSMTKDIRLDDGTYNIASLDALAYSTERHMNTIIRLGVSDERTCMA